MVWSNSIGDYTGIPGNFSRATPAVYEDMLILGDQGGRLGAGARVMAADSNTGELIWSAPAGNIIRSPSLRNRRSCSRRGLCRRGLLWKILTALDGACECYSLRGSVMAFDANTGEILWRFASGRSCNAGASVVDGTVDWGSGYASFGPPYTANDKLRAFELPE